MIENKKFQTLDDFLKEMDSRGFRNGVNTAIRASRWTGQETLLSTLYDRNYGIFHRPITVGEEKGVPSVAPENGLDLDLPPEESHRSIDRYVVWVRKNYYSGSSLEQARKYLQENMEYLIDFHTHLAVFNITPSPGDLKRLNEMRRDNSTVNPISVILGVPEKKDTVFLFSLIRERRAQPFGQDNNFEELSKQLKEPYLRWINRLSSDSVELTEAEVSSGEGNLAKKMYDYKLGVYTSEGFYFP